MYIINHDSDNLFDSLDKTICKYKFSSILLIKIKLENQKPFSFQPISKLDIEKEIQNLKKATTKNTILPKISKVIYNTSVKT